MDDAHEPYTPLIADQMDLEDFWHELMGPLGFSSPSLWLVVLGPDERPLPHVVEIAEAHDLPTDVQRSGFVEVLEHITETLPSGISVAFLRTRPGTDAIGITDRRWAAMLYAAARSAGVACATVHSANDVHLVPVPWDDLPLTHPA